MQTGGGREPSELRASTLFDDAIYQREVLSLPEGKSEDDLDQEVVDEAQQLGIKVHQYLPPDPQDISTALSTITVSSEPRSSISVRSHESHSTGFTSDPSRNSKDQYGENCSANPNIPQPRSSMSFEGHDPSAEASRPSMRHAVSSSTTSTAGSTYSLSLVAERPGIKRRRGSGLFSMFRLGPQQCSSCPARVRHGHHGNPFAPRLECGHSLTKYATRVHVQDALERGDHRPPSCCAKPLPRSVLEMALTKAEMDSLAKELPLPDSETANGSQTRSSEHSMVELTPPTGPQSPISLGESCPPSPRETTPEENARLEKAMEDEQFRVLRAQEAAQFQKIVSFEVKQRRTLISYHEWAKTRISSQLTRSKEKKTKEHAQYLEQLEERQVAAEHDLRRAQLQEQQNVATALKYMEAYCNGPNSSEHIVSEDDRRKLKRQHAVQDNLPRKHDSAINVLRSKQEKDVKVQMHNQHTELVQMDLDFEKETRQLDTKFHKDLSKLDVLAETRRRKVMARWDLKVEIWRKQFEKAHEMRFDGSIPHPDWPIIPMAEPASGMSALATCFQLRHHEKVAT